MTSVTATAAGPPAAGSQQSSRRGLLILLLLCGAQFLVVLDATIVNVALPSIQRALGFTEQNLQWVASGYALTFAGFLLLGGRAADLLGRRRIFMAGIVLFIAASLAGGLATTSGMLLGARFVQGIGGAILSPAALSLLTTSFGGAAQGPGHLRCDRRRRRRRGCAVRRAADQRPRLALGSVRQRPAGHRHRGGHAVADQWRTAGLPAR
jgi:MFS family permease